MIKKGSPLTGSSKNGDMVKKQQPFNINNLRYVDDTVLITNTEENLQRLLDVIKECSSEAGLDINVNKTETMVISKHPERDK